MRVGLLRVAGCGSACGGHHAGCVLTLPPCHADFLTVTTTVGLAEELLQAEYHSFTHKYRTNFNVMRLGSGSYTLPTAVAEAVDFVGPTVRFPAVQQLTLRAQPSSPDLGVTPSFLRKLYKVGDATGKASNNNQTVAQFLGQYYSPSDLQSFFKQFSTSEEGKTPTEIGPNDSSNPGMEASLDIQYVRAPGHLHCHAAPLTVPWFVRGCVIDAYFSVCTDHERCYQRGHYVLEHRWPAAVHPRKRAVLEVPDRCWHHVWQRCPQDYLCILR